MTPWLFVSPALAIYTVFTIVPIITVVSYSTFRWSGVVRDGFVGIQNFVDVLTAYPIAQQLGNAVGHNAWIFIGLMVLQNVVALVLAQLLFSIGRVRNVFRTLIALPYLVNTLAVGYLWTLLLSPVYGPVAGMLNALGLETWVMPWLGDPNTALPAVILITAWQYMGFPMLIFVAALGGLPEEVNEAAMLDGANAWQRFLRITVPQLVPTMGTLALLTFIAAFASFELPYAIGGTDGNPSGATDVIGLIFYRTAFNGGVNGIGESSAIASLMFFGIFIASGILLWVLDLLRRRFT